jgi:hypothetical protein
MPAQVTYNEALRFASYCYIVDEFLSEYGLAYRWRNIMIDTGELLAFVDRIMGQ